MPREGSLAVDFIMTIFICHTEQDADAARSLQEALYEFGYQIVSVSDDLKIGEEWQESILENIDAAKVVLILWSEASAKSELLLAEAEYSNPQAGHATMHIRLDTGLDLPKAFDRETQYFFSHFGPQPGEFETILAHILSLLGPPDAARSSAEILTASADQRAPEYVLGGDSARNIIDTAWHPLADGIAPDWASGWGEDEHGVFVEITVGEVSQALRWCPPGRFLIGSPEDETERHGNEGPQTEITFERGFWLFETAVTQAFYEAVTGEDPSHFKRADRPVEQVSWDDAQSFLKAINQAHPGLELRLPSEAEWEYACRARSETPFEPNVARHFSGASITAGEVNYDANFPYAKAPKGEYRKETVGVRSTLFRPNGWGLWHMHGNVWEWCEDVWKGSHAGALPDGSPRPSSKKDGGSTRVVRGGSWLSRARSCRAAYRLRLAPGSRSSLLGFRPARGQASGAPARAAEP